MPVLLRLGTENNMHLATLPPFSMTSYMEDTPLYEAELQDERWSQLLPGGEDPSLLCRRLPHFTLICAVSDRSIEIFTPLVQSDPMSRVDFRISVTGLVKFFVASHLRRPKVRNICRKFTKPVMAFCLSLVEREGDEGKVEGEVMVMGGGSLGSAWMMTEKLEITIPASHCMHSPVLV